MIRITITALALAALSGCAGSQTAPAAPAAAASSGNAAHADAHEAFARVSIDELSTAIANHENVAIFDNNSRERYETGHVPGARWVAHDQVTAEVLPQDRNARLVFYCANEHCGACHTAANQALSLGYRNVAILPAGIMGWTSAGKPVVTGANPT